MKSVNDTKPKIIYEWVVTMNNGENIILTENQYEVLKNHIQENENPGQIFFSDFMINPVFILSTYKRPADEIKNKYPCPRCHQSGYDPDDRSFWCKNCEGTGVELPK